jgi:uncharacterized protein (DUF4415 family)
VVCFAHVSVSRLSFCVPISLLFAVRLDADVLAWLKSRGKGYQTRINRLLRAAMETHPRHTRSRRP